ncbi:hypothetical protein ASPVEDRAFT_88039 [Aspergillus versicolor CBS 583.65]|uniref:Uncharacterized protein n=1 Tax=Aspergillus versicolor CBS 583.65 TaxID=1036611 RepID=A0A1L9PZ90_ASPVE|nr:uncharacterized protein ASPVEDRAFT_88039 [Aspergillus versicolor CBS 583.65]OJJ06752.1 hypothetical protein ASPVEDRAFT_88039 [Aspergillus versicolor CBS 583.65]
MQNLPLGDPILKGPLKVACIQMPSYPDNGGISFHESYTLSAGAQVTVVEIEG